MTSLHARAAAALGWSVADAQSLSLQSLRDLVRPIAPDLAADISAAVSTGRHIRRVDKAAVVEAARAQAQQARQGVTPPRDGTHAGDPAACLRDVLDVVDNHASPGVLSPAHAVAVARIAEALREGRVTSAHLDAALTVLLGWTARSAHDCVEVVDDLRRLGASAMPPRHWRRFTGDAR